jgi:ribonuclease P protein component
LRPQQRIRKHAEFDRVMRRGQRLGDGVLTIWALRQTLGVTRLGLVVGKKHGNAPQRNRVKRVLREAFRLSQHELPGNLDLAIAPRAGVSLDTMAAAASLLKLARRADQRLEPPRE